MRHEVKFPPFPARYFWSDANKRRGTSSIAALSIELGPRAYRCLIIEHRDGRDTEGMLEMLLGHEAERQRSLAKRIAELEALEAEIMEELGDAA